MPGEAAAESENRRISCHRAFCVCVMRSESLRVLVYFFITIAALEGKRMWLHTAQKTFVSMGTNIYSLFTVTAILPVPLDLTPEV